MIYSVYGCWPTTEERYGDTFEASTPRDAERLMQLWADEAGADFWVSGVLEGIVPSVDTYTAFVDPQDVRNETAEGLEPDEQQLVITTYTVLGIARNPTDPEAYEDLIGERYADTVEALSAGAAEDVARLRLAERGGELWVCAVLEGQHRRVDVYATFVDPDAAVA